MMREADRPTDVQVHREVKERNTHRQVKRLTER